MRELTIGIILFFSQIDAFGQEIKGQIIDSKNNKPLEYVSVGIVNTNIGAITDKNGFFNIACKTHDTSSNVRVSMIGYESQTFLVKNLLNNYNVINMIEKSYEISEVVITPTIERTVGATGFNRSQGWSGWSGIPTRRGYEIGIKLDLGDKPVKVNSLHVMLHRQAFDTSIFRLHIREMQDTLILDELLTENIFITITNESGWTKIDLQQNNIILSKEIGLTLEWLEIRGINEDRAMKINDRYQKAYLLFKNKKNQTTIRRWGTEANWVISKGCSPSMFLTVLE